MDDVRGVADQREALGDERARDRTGRADRRGAADRRDLAEMQAEAPLELGVEFGIGQRHDALGLVRLLGPDDRRAAARLSGRIANGPAGRKCSSARP